MQRFFLENLETSNYNFVLNDKELFKQITKVLRSEIWDKFIFLMGKTLLIIFLR